MLDGLQETATEVIVDAPKVDLKLALPPQPATVREMNMPNVIEKLRAMFLLQRSITPRHFN